MLDGKRILVTGGTGSLGKILVKRLLSGAHGTPAKIIIFSRDEAKQHFMRLEYQQKKAVTDEVIYHNFDQILEFRIGDVRDFYSVFSAVKDADIVINAAALKQVPTCEYFPYEAVLTNIAGAENIVKVVNEHHTGVDTVMGVSTDKACKPVTRFSSAALSTSRSFVSAFFNAFATSRASLGATKKPVRPSLIHSSALAVMPNTGGFDLEKTAALRQKGPVSKRKHIMLKGYQGWAGRALTGLQAFECCKDLLKGYTVVIYSPVREVLIAAELFEQDTGIRVKVLPPGTPHEDVLAWHGKSRISLGLSISDAISTSLVEAMVMGSFPIQSFTACADEWIKDGRTGFLVAPNDARDVAKALKKALTNDRLVDRAAEENRVTVNARLNRKIIQPRAAVLYEYVYEESRKQSKGKLP